MMTLTLVQAACADGLDKTFRCAVIKKLWRDLRFVLEVHFNRVALAGPDSQAVFAEGKALFVVGRDDVFELVQRERNAVLACRLQQFVNVHPASAIERKPDSFGFVAENQAQEFADSDGVFVTHREGVSGVWISDQ